MIKLALEKQKQILEAKGYKVAYICLYGSQNYGLQLNTDDYKSDIDMKAIIIPTLDDLVYNSKPISTVIATEWGDVDVKDIRVYIDTLLKANPAYVETLYTDYYIIDYDFKIEMDLILSMKDELIHALRCQFLRAMYGMSLEKEKALCHPYPSIKEKIEKYHYDGKQLHHILRLNLMMKDYFINEKPLKECFMPPEKDLKQLIDFKLNKPTLDEALKYSKELIEDSRNIRDDILNNINENNIDYSIKDKIIGLSRNIIKNKIIDEVKNIYD